MLGPNDLKNLAQVIDPTHENVESHEYDVSHLDYGYVSKCTSIPELQSLLSILKSGKEGYYPDLENYIKQRIAAVDPLQAEPELSAEQAKTLEAEISELINQNTGSQTTITTSANNSSQSIENIAQDFKENLEIPSSAVEREYLADLERRKGNEAFVENDYEQAKIHYLRSFQMFQSFLVCNNLSLLYLKLSDNGRAEFYATKSIDIKPNYKAYLRRAKAYFNQDTVRDCEKAAEFEESGIEDSQLKTNAMRKYKDAYGVKLMVEDEIVETQSKQDNFRRIQVIDEDFDSDEEQ